MLPVVLDAWLRNNSILVNLLHVLPPNGLATRASHDSPTVAQMFTHMHSVRLDFLAEDAPQFALPSPAEEWHDERSAERIAALLNESAEIVYTAVQSLVEQGVATAQHFDHPILLLQHLTWHEAYHHGQIKLALKLSGIPISDELAGPATWSVWMNKTS